MQREVPKVLVAALELGVPNFVAEGLGEHDEASAFTGIGHCLWRLRGQRSRRCADRRRGR